MFPLPLQMFQLKMLQGRKDLSEHIIALLVRFKLYFINPFSIVSGDLGVGNFLLGESS